MSDYFQAAYERARARYAQDQWLRLDPRQRTEAIYREMRQIDAESVAARKDLPDAGQTKPAAADRVRRAARPAVKRRTSAAPRRKTGPD